MATNKDDNYINLENAQEMVNILKDMIYQKPDVITSIVQPSSQNVGGTWNEILNDVTSNVTYSGKKITSSEQPIKQNPGDVWDEVL